jgi:flagellar hook assembly protein FlgD
LGVKVATLEDNDVNAGYHSVTWNVINNNGAQIPTGVYFYQIQTTSLANGAQFQETKKMMLAK